MDLFNLKTFQDECEENTKIITSKHMFNASLKEHCMNTIIDSLRMSSKVTIDLQRLADLPLVLRQELLQKMCYANATVFNEEDAISAEVRFKVASIILEQISEFNFKCLQRRRSTDEFVISKETDSPYLNAIPRSYYKQQMFALLAQKCRKNLQRLIYFEEIHAAYLAWTDFVYPALLGSLIKLSNLQHLELTKYALRKSEFALLGSKLVNLVHLNCIIVDATPSSLSKGLRPMKKLQVFIFSNVITDDKNKPKFFQLNNNKSSLYHVCMKEFPRLKVVGQNANGKLTQDSSFQLHGKIHSFGIDDDTLYGPRCRSQLEHLILGEPISQGQVEWHSNVTTLSIVLLSFEDMKDIENLNQLKNVRSLILNGPIWSVARAAATTRRFLQVFGPNLNSLYLYANTDGMALLEILRLCPNLTTLSIDCQFTNPNSFNPQLDDVQPFKNLTKIYFALLDFSQNPELLVKLFTAPKLEHLELLGTNFSASSSAKLLMDIRMHEEAIAPRLTTLILKYPGFAEQYDDCFHPMMPKYYNEFILLFQFVYSKAPLLKTIVIVTWDGFIDAICHNNKRERYIPKMIHYYTEFKFFVYNR